MEFGTVIMGNREAVVSPHYLASVVGIKTLMKGGNAVDAAVAMNATLCVVYPHMSGIGGDLFLLVYLMDSGKLIGLNSSGRASSKASIEFFEKMGISKMPSRGILSVTVPGVVDGWSAALERYGTMDLKTLLKPAINYAEKGFPVTARLSKWIKKLSNEISKYPSTRKVFLKNGLPNPGDILVQKDLAKTLKMIGEYGKDVFYNGDIAKRIFDFSIKNGGILELEDLKKHRSEWINPVQVDYRNFKVYELPPNTQGIAALLALNILEGYDLTSFGFQKPNSIHVQIEAMKLALMDRDKYISDPDFVKIPIEKLLSKEYAKEKSKSIDLNMARAGSLHKAYEKDDTVYLAVVDKEGNAVSLIQSLAYAFGCCLVVENTGILLNNRAVYFSLNKNHVNKIEPGKRTMHTLIPAMVFKENEPFMVFGTMGGDGQPQFHIQLISNVMDFKKGVKESLEAPRWRIMANSILMEEHMPTETIEKLREKNHEIKLVESWDEIMGHAHKIIVNKEKKVLYAASDPRSDGLAIAF
ncbi:MAG: gamma-glutamyltransferase [Candidatus Bathyarchaeia archaeon]